ncbi:CrcB protein [Kibdelosporangium banguiense]|uniref:Fluoride-specific ion channel FluC n=1 Tax=Kibdelosporangium banguiense TaxID=1365924 RepID=A0ABS4T885_9PSEU|nr:CrcB family protein [Kibdelosporangium banguiense]MBP2320063.1 CrcB protein [Kibdelosporangium banguiense]
MRSELPVVAAVSLGGGLGTLARYGAGLLLPTVPGRFPWGTFGINVLGCFLIGVLMVLATEVMRAHRLIRPFLGVGVLGGFTTFSTYAVESVELFPSVTAFVYLAGTLIAAVPAAAAGVWLVRRLARRP